MIYKILIDIVLVYVGFGGTVFIGGLPERKLPYFIALPTAIVLFLGSIALGVWIWL